MMKKVYNIRLKELQIAKNCKNGKKITKKPQRNFKETAKKKAR